MKATHRAINDKITVACHPVVTEGLLLIAKLSAAPLQSGYVYFISMQTESLHQHKQTHCGKRLRSVFLFKS